MADKPKESTLEKLLDSKSEALRRVGFEIYQEQQSGKSDPAWADSTYGDAYGDFWSNSSDGRWWDYQGKEAVKKAEAKPSEKYKST